MNLKKSSSLLKRREEIPFHLNGFQSSLFVPVLLPALFGLKFSKNTNKKPSKQLLPGTLE